MFISQLQILSIVEQHQNHNHFSIVQHLANYITNKNIFIEMLKLITMTWRPSRELTLGYCCFQNDLNFSHVWSQMGHLSGPYIRGSLLLWSWSLALLGLWTIVHILLIPYNNSFFTAGANYPTSHEGWVDRRTSGGLPQQYQGQKVSHSVALAYWSEVKMCSTLM